MIDRNSDPHLTMEEATTYWGGFIGEHYLRLKLFGRLRVHAERAVLARQLPERGIVAIPRIDPSTISPDRFRNEYIKGYAPVVLAGVGAASPAVKKWTPGFFKSEYGTEKICVRVKAAGVGAESLYTREGTMAELIDNITSGGEHYATNLEDLF